MHFNIKLRIVESNKWFYKPEISTFCPTQFGFLLGLDSNTEFALHLPNEIPNDSIAVSASSPAQLVPIIPKQSLSDVQVLLALLRMKPAGGGIASDFMQSMFVKIIYPGNTDEMQNHRLFIFIVMFGFSIITNTILPSGS